MTPLDLPTSYLAFDLETSGLKISDPILEWGHCLVHDTHPVERRSIIFNWYLVDTYRHDILDYQLWRQGQSTKLQSPFTKDLLQSRGVHPTEALREIERLVTSGHPLVGHNILSFDLPRLRHHLPNLPFLEGIDVGRIVRSRLPRNARWNLRSCCAYYSIPAPNHTAYEDSFVCHQLLERLRDSSKH